MNSALSYAFVDFAEDRGPRSGTTYGCISATDPGMADHPICADPACKEGAFSVLVQVLTLWIHDMPDLWHRNEGVLKLSGATRRRDRPDEKLDVAVSLDFGVRDGRRAGVEYQLGFDGLLIKNQLTLGFKLVELDKDPAKYYQQLKDAIGPASGKELLAMAKGVPYLELATQIADGLLKAFGKNANDAIWASTPMFAVSPAPGAPYLRSGVYVAYENERGDINPETLSYKDERVRHADTAEPIKRNYLVFSIALTSPEGTTDAGHPLAEEVRNAA
jgi:hypothetical protein